MLRHYLVLPCLAACASTHHEHTTTSIGTGYGAITAVCDSTLECTSDLQKDPRCDGAYHERCTLIEHTGATDLTLMTEDHGITPLVFDAKHSVAWVAVGPRVVGVGTSKSGTPGAQLQPPELVANYKYVEAKRVIAGGNVIVFKQGHKFRLWDVPGARAVEVDPSWPFGSDTGYVIGDAAIGYCSADNDQLHWMTIDIAGSLEAGAGRVETGVTPVQTRRDAKPCAEARAR